MIKIKRNLRSRIIKLLKSTNVKKMYHTFELIGCSPDEFKKHIEKQFTDGMTWDNYGEWHIDHIIPCFTFNLLEEDEQFKCFHYSNQRPLWAKDNLSRSRNEFKKH